MDRRSRREQLFKLLFRVEFNELSEMDEQARLYFENLDHEIKDENREELTERLGQVLSLLPEIDQKITDKVTDWTINRMGKVELTILRIAVFEMFFDDDVPVEVAANEAVEIAKKYGQEESGAFVNGAIRKLNG